MQEREALVEYLTQHNLRLTRQRELILETFLQTDKHISAEELYEEIRKFEPSIGLATVYRTLNLFCECGLAQKRQFGDGQTRYDHIYAHKHHAHLICVHCKAIIEFESPEIERLQLAVAASHRYKILSRKLELYGLCEECARAICDSCSNLICEDCSRVEISF